MKYLLILMLIFRAAHATDQVIYYTVKGSNVTTQEALLASLRGQTVFKCQNVEAKPNKKGTSISMRNVKKSKAAE